MKTIACSCLILLFTATSAQNVRESIQERRSDVAVGATATSSAPDYTNLYYWAAHPLKHDASDSIPAFLKNEKIDSSADVFFLHPTTYTGVMKEGEWNADVNNETLNTYTDNRTILNQASIFNGSCKVFAPRYRQAHLRAFFSINNQGATDAFDVAYQDLKTAFQYYLDNYNHGRPIVIAAHSQGSLHAIRLLKEFFDGKPLQKQLVCAYVVGWRIKPTDLNNIPLGTTPTTTGCIVGWRSFKKGTSDWLILRENGNSLCVNPISWTASSTWASGSLHKGMVGKNFNELISGNVAAGVDEQHKILNVELSGTAQSFIRTNNYHVADYNLFYMNVRENVRERINAFLQKNK